MSSMASWLRPCRRVSQLGQPLVLNFWEVSAGGGGGDGDANLQGLDERADHARAQMAHLAGRDVVAGHDGGDVKLFRSRSS